MRLILAFILIFTATSMNVNAKAITLVTHDLAPNESFKRGLSTGISASKNVARDRYAENLREITDQKWVWFYLKKHYPIKLSVLSSCAKNCARTSSFLGSNMHRWLGTNGYSTTYPPSTTEALVEKVRVGDIKVHKVKPLYVYFSNTVLRKDETLLKRFNAAAFRV